MTKLHVGEDGKAARNLGQVLQACNRAKDLVQQILTFSRQKEQERRPLQISLIVKEALKLLRASLPATIEIQKNIQTDAYILGDPTELHQVIMNLCTNAGDAMGQEGGVLEVTLEEADPRADGCGDAFESQAGPCVRLTVRDTGCGISPQIMERIFDPFFTTKGVGKGTGMGLSVVHGIVKAHHGVIKAYSEPGVGTTFRVYFPMCEQEETAVEGQTLEFPRGTERILFLDDEPPLADLGKQMLEDLGYRVTVRTSPLEALEAFRDHPEAFDLVITDKTMPHLTGFDLTRELRSIRKEIPVIMCTGYGNPEDLLRAKSERLNLVLMKPLVLRTLAEAVRGVLDGVRQEASPSGSGDSGKGCLFFG